MKLHSAGAEVATGETPPAPPLQVCRCSSPPGAASTIYKHGYVLALSRRAKYGEGDTALVAEFRDAALRLFALDDVRWIAASFAGSALVEWAKRVGEPGDLDRALEAYLESERRATDDAHRAYSLHDQAEVLHLQGRRADALERTERALKLDPTTRHMRFDVES